MELNNVTFSHGRIIPSNTKYDPTTNRGVNFHENWFSRTLADLFGSGVVEVKIEGKSFYLSKASCFKLLKSLKAADTSTNDVSKELQNFIVQNPGKIISQVQSAINQIKSSPLFSEKIYNHLDNLLGEQAVKGAVIYKPTDERDLEDPKKYPFPVMKGSWKSTPFIGIKVVPADPEAYFHTTDERTVARIAKTDEERLQLKNERLNAIPFEAHLIVLRQQSETELWVNLGNTSVGSPAFFSGRSYAYNIQDPPGEIDEMKIFFHSLLKNNSAVDGYGIKWKLAPLSPDI